MEKCEGGKAGEVLRRKWWGGCIYREIDVGH